MLLKLSNNTSKFLSRYVRVFDVLCETWFLGSSSHLNFVLDFYSIKTNRTFLQSDSYIFVDEYSQRNWETTYRARISKLKISIHLLTTDISVFKFIGIVFINVITKIRYFLFLNNFLLFS